MHRIVASILGLLLLVAPSFASLPVRVVLLEGSPYQRGITHGQTLKEQIHAVLRLWKAELQRQYRTDLCQDVPSQDRLCARHAEVDTRIARRDQRNSRGCRRSL